MTDLKCIRCGADNLVLGGVCRFCTVEMQPARSYLPKSTPFFDEHPEFVFETRTSATNSSIGPFLGVSDVLAPTFRLFINNLWLITKLVFVIVAPLEILKVVTVGERASTWQFQSGTLILQLMSSVLIAPALIFALMKVMQTGVSPGVNQCYRWGFSKLGKLTLCSLMVWALQALGFSLCFVPGILISLALSIVYPLAVLENRSPANVLRDSNELTKGHRWNIFLATLVVLGIVSISAVTLTGLATLLAQNYLTFWPIPVAEIIGDILGQSSTILSLVIYLSIRRTLSGGYAQ